MKKTMWRSHHIRYYDKLNKSMPTNGNLKSQEYNMVDKQHEFASRRMTSVPAFDGFQNNAFKTQVTANLVDSLGWSAPKEENKKSSSRDSRSSNRSINSKKDYRSASYHRMMEEMKRESACMPKIPGRNSSNYSFGKVPRYPMAN